MEQVPVIAEILWNKEAIEDKTNAIDFHRSKNKQIKEILVFDFERFGNGCGACNNGTIKKSDKIST